MEKGSVRSPARTISFRSSGGRIGTSRFRALLDLVDPRSDITPMISRRQALALHGLSNEIPDFLLNHLSASDFTDSNVKSYPVASGGELHEYIVDTLEELSGNGSGVSLAYSPTETYRAHLRWDDFSLHKITEDGFRLDSNLWGDSPRTLIKRVEAKRLPLLFTGLRLLLEGTSGREIRDEFSVRSTRSRLLRSLNNSLSTADQGPLGTGSLDRSERFVSERDFFEDGKFCAGLDGGSQVWLLFPVTTGILTEECAEKLLDLLERFTVTSMRFTPEQNILLPLQEDVNSESIPFSLVDPEGLFGDPRYCPRISTCPGSTFCANVKTSPVELARRLIAHFRGDPFLVGMNHRIPIGITGCGETKPLEERHPIGIYPVGAGTYGISLGGSLHGSGRCGRALEDTFTLERIPRVIEDLWRAFDDSSMDHFQEWCRECGELFSGSE